MSLPNPKTECVCAELNQYRQPCSEQDPCEKCCEHGDQDDYCCLDCGKEMTEDRMAAAYDRAKDAWKYGGCL